MHSKKIKTCWIISDGTQGMENQSKALAKGLGIEVKIIKINPPKILRIFPIIGAILPKSIFNFIHYLKEPWPNFIISTGKRMAGISILIKRLLKNKIITIHIQNPKLPSYLFDLLIVPEHDNISGPNIIKTKGSLSFIDKKNIDDSFGKQSTKKKKTLSPLIFVLIGGDNKRYNFTNTDYYNLASKIAIATKKISGTLIISTSRRTSSKAILILKKVLSVNNCKFYFWPGLNLNPYPGMLKISDYILVTSDSVNMVSETATLNKPVFVAYIDKESGKIRHFLNDLENNQIIKNFDGIFFNYKKRKLNTNFKTISKINKFFRSKNISQLP